MGGHRTIPIRPGAPGMACALLLVLAAACDGGSGGGRPRGGPDATITAPTGGTLSGDVRIEYVLVDKQADLAQAIVSYSTTGGKKWRTATESLDPASEGTIRLATAPAPGTPHVYVWDSLSDLGARQFGDVKVRVIAYDDRARGKKAVSQPFIVDNRSLVPQYVTDVSDTMFNSIFDRIEVDFVKPVDRGTVIYQGGGPGTIAVFQDNDTAPGGPFSLVPGSISHANGDERLIFTPTSPFPSRREVHLAITRDLRDTVGRRLDTALGYPTDPPSHTGVMPEQIFEYRFIPDVGPNTARYVLVGGTDPWYFDFDTFGGFDDDLSNHGLRGSDPLVAAWARDRMIADVLGWTSLKYRRSQADGSGPSGAWRISFTGMQPGGAPGSTYSRMCLGLNMGNLWGAAWYDPGNNFREDDCQRSNPPLGVFTGSVTGVDSSLSPMLGPSDLPFVDGTYVLGTSASMDARFLRVRDVIADYSHAIAVTAAHEVGHSVGLDHYSSSTLNIMYPSASPGQASDRNARFGTESVPLLDSNLGVVP